MEKVNAAQEAMFRESRMRWANQVEDEINNIRDDRTLSPQEIDQRIRQRVLERIAWDDQNAFGHVGDMFIPEESVFDKDVLLTRMNFEIGLPQLPEQMRQRLQEIAEKVEGTDFSNKRKYLSIRKKYLVKVARLARDLYDSDLPEDAKYKRMLG